MWKPVVGVISLSMEYQGKKLDWSAEEGGEKDMEGTQRGNS